MKTIKSSQNHVIILSARVLLRRLIVLTTLGATLAIQAAVTKYDVNIKRSGGQTKLTVREAGPWRGDSEHKDANERVSNLLKQKGFYGFNKLGAALKIIANYYKPGGVSGLARPYATDAWLLQIVGQVKNIYDEEDDPRSPGYINHKAMEQQLKAEDQRMKAMEQQRKSIAEKSNGRYPPPIPSKKRSK